MTGPNGRFLPWYAAFVGAATASACVIACVGYFPTVRIAGQDAVWAMVIGCGVSWVASCVGAIPLAMAASGRSSQPAMAVLGSTVLRFLTVLLLVVPLVLGSSLDRRVMIFWVAVSYLLMLLVDTAFAIRVTKRVKGNES